MSLQINQQRQKQLARWVLSVIPDAAKGKTVVPLKAIGGDAGFRHYYRVQSSLGSLVAVDANPETEDNHTFVAIAETWRNGGVPVPEVKAVDYQHGFMLQEDFGDTPLQAVLNEDTADHYYQQAFSTLMTIQEQPPESLLPYDETLLSFELSLYPDWFLRDLLGMGEDIPDLQPMFTQLVTTILQQPFGTVHRDYHSRNLMLCGGVPGEKSGEKSDENSIGVIDFQGALNGPLLYDPVSLLKDCYVRWPDARINSWLQSFTSEHPVLKNYDPELIRSWFDLTGLQRHLKCLGIFSRLWFRDRKPGYLGDIPRTFEYVLEVCQRYPQFKDHARWLEQHVQPVLAERVKAVQAEAVQTKAVQEERQMS